MPRSRGIPLDRWLRRRRAVATLALLAGAALLLAALMRPPDRLHDIAAIDRVAVPVVEVIDGRTLRVRGPDGRERTIELLGLRIDAAHTDEARRRVASVIADRPVILAFDSAQLTAAGAAEPLPAFVYTADGRFLNEWLIEQRLARADGSRHAMGDWFTRLDRRIYKGQ